MSTTVNYKGNTIATLSNETKTLTTAGTWVEDDIEIIDSSASISLQSKTATPTESAQTITADAGYNGLSSVEVGAISSSYVGTGVTRNDSSDMTTSGGTVTAPAGYYESASSKSVSAGTEGIPTATKGTALNHSITITPSVTNTEGYISGGTKTGTAVTVTASELASGNKAITQNGTGIDVVGYSTVSVDVPAGITIDEIAKGTKPAGDIVVTSTKLVQHAFSYMTGITSVTLVNNIITWSGNNAFGWCTGLTTVNAPNLTTLRNKIFVECTNLVNVNMPKLTTTDGDQTIEKTSVVYLVFPSFTGRVYQNTFRYNTKLKAVDLNKCTQFGPTCFNGCTALNVLVIRDASLPTLSNINVFNNTPFASGKAGGTLYVPSSMISSYQAASNWSTILGYSNNSIAAIEGSIYETQYVDGIAIT